MRSCVLLIASVLSGFLSSIAVGQSVEREAGPLPRFYPHQETYLEIEAERRTHFSLTYTVASEDGIPPAEIEMWYEQDGERVSLAIDGRGRITHRPDAETLANAPSVFINQEGGGMSLNMQFEAILPGGPDYAVADLNLALGQANHAMREAAGVAALFAPNFRTLIFVFDGPAPSATAIMADGSSRALTAQENRIIVRPRDRSMRNLTRIELGDRPFRVLLDS
ncbi:hypothetical protein [uncultured Maricaulis sp.]|uniref:hypothetical protein n=1 Tax=uncultured Maricaulis sp. TaxID=174710 RepID=UPI0025EBFC7C|nr:hypothetical protein [uncultured Maricaulis sp.]